VFGRPGRDGELDLAVGGGELGKKGLDEATGNWLVQLVAGICRRGTKNILHALGTARPVTVVKVHLLALQDEGSDAILEYGQHLSRSQIKIPELSYPAGGDLL
jgi:hypothetical protein